MSEWFERWFGKEYLALYPHRDEAEAERMAVLLTAWGIGGPGQVMLDLACGAGRHAAALSRRGARVVGYDLSWPMLLAARSRRAGALVRGDMRLLGLRGGAFDAVVNLFTSFGYFDDDAQHLKVLLEVRRVLKPRGRFVLDYLNAPWLRATLVPRDERRVSSRVIVQDRSISEDGRFVIKSISVLGEGLSFLERVRLYDRSTLEAMLGEAGLTPLEALGDYDGRPHGDDSPRLILLSGGR